MAVPTPPVSPPAASKLESIAARVLSPGPYSAPGLLVAIQRNDGRTERFVTGVDGAGRPLESDTLVPYSSIGKLAVGLLVLRLVNDGVIGLDDPIQRFVPGAADNHPSVTVRRLLTHTSGLPLDLPAAVVPYRRGVDWRTIGRGCTVTPLEVAPHTIVQYSNIGYGLMALMVESVTGEPFLSCLKRVVLKPLGADLFPSNELPRPPAVVADIRSRHAGTELEPVNSEFWRSLVLPWAPLFGTIDGLVALVRGYGEAASIVSPELLAEARADQNVGLRGGFATHQKFGYNATPGIVWPWCAWGLGVEVRGDKMPHWTPPSAGLGSYGHLGATGCLVWCDPDRGVAWALTGLRTTDSGWIIRYGPLIGAVALDWARA